MKLSLPAGSIMQDPRFLFGVATSSFQIEGAADRRLSSIWDTFCAQPGKIRDGSDGSVACDHLARWHDDLNLIASLGVDAYRFSVSWPRVLRRDGSLNDEGIGFYVRLLDRLNELGIKPFVTLYHWDLPQHLEDSGGWLSRDTTDRFRDYVDRVSRVFGDRVYSYATLNEPFCSAYLGYETGVHAPGLASKSYGKKAAHNLLLAHGKAMQVLDANSPDSQNGIVLNFTPCYPASDREADRRAASLADQQFNQWYLKPLMHGRYPELIDALPLPERPDIHDGDMELIAHPLDILGVNYYTRAVYRAAANSYEEVAPQGKLTDMGWEVYPQGLADLLVTLASQYDLPPLFVAENGAAMADRLTDGAVDDPERIAYLQQHLEAVDSAIRQGVSVNGFFYWSLMDNFEWAEGYRKRFGLVYVDYETQERIPKASAIAYRELLGKRAQASKVARANR